MWWVNFREKGDDAGLGGFIRADSAEARDSITDWLKACGLRVVYESVPAADEYRIRRMR